MNTTASSEMFQEAVVIAGSTNCEQRREQQRSGDRKDRRRNVRTQGTLDQEEILRRGNEILANMKADIIHPMEQVLAAA